MLLVLMQGCGSGPATLETASHDGATPGTRGWGGIDDNPRQHAGCGSSSSDAGRMRTGNTAGGAELGRTQNNVGNREQQLGGHGDLRVAGRAALAHWLCEQHVESAIQTS